MSDSINKNNIDHNQFNNVPEPLCGDIRACAPEEIINNIWQYLSSLDHTVLVHVCRRFRYNTLGYYDIVSKKNQYAQNFLHSDTCHSSSGHAIMVALGMR